MNPDFPFNNKCIGQGTLTTTTGSRSTSDARYYNGGVWVVTTETEGLGDNVWHRGTATLGLKSEVIKYLGEQSAQPEGFSKVRILSITLVQDNGAVFRYVPTIDAETNTFGLLETTRLSCATSTVRPNAPRNPNKND